MGQTLDVPGPVGQIGYGASLIALAIFGLAVYYRLTPLFRSVGGKRGEDASLLLTLALVNTIHDYVLDR